MPEPFIWRADYALGLDFMDVDHREAIGQINAIAKASRAGSPDLIRHLAVFTEHCEAHFAREEAAMLDAGFPAYDCHKGEHERVLGNLRAWLVGLETMPEGDREATFEGGLKAWLLGHLATMDTVTAHYIRAHRTEQVA